MEFYGIVAGLLVLTFSLGYMNYRFIRLPQAIGLMLTAMLFSLLIIVIGRLSGNGLEAYAGRFVSRIDFNETLMVGMLGFLLFAGALHINLNDLAQKKWEVAVFSVFSTAISTVIVGSLAYLLFQAFGLGIGYAYALLFGALISPTDPVAVLSILKEAQAPKSLETKIAGESLFNDGIGVVFFLGIFGIATKGEHFSLGRFTHLLVTEAVGGIVLGFLLGYGTYLILKKIDNFQLEIIGTIALVMSVYALAFHWHMSGPIAIVVAGLLMGNQGRQFAMSENTRKNLDAFWELADDILNALLFVLIGLEVLMVKFSGRFVAAGILLIGIILAARFISVALPVAILRWCNRKFTRGVVMIMTWGGLRGGISVALVLSLPRGTERDVLLVVTYIVVVFSILAQGLTMRRLVKHKLAC